MSASSAFLQLHPRIQRYLWSERWGALRAVQELVIPKILPADRDVIVAASMASGKTEAAFLPALTHLLGQERPGLIVYVSPLKALINDQLNPWTACARTWKCRCGRGTVISAQRAKRAFCGTRGVCC
jgi:Lhr-like helicase